MRKQLVLSVVIAVAGCGASVDGSEGQGSEALAPTDEAPTGRGTGLSPGIGGPSGSSRVGGGGMVFHGGPVMTGRTNVYFVWYGGWTGNTATTILTSFASSLGGSPYFNINTTYYDGSGTPITNAVSYARAATDAYSHGTSLSDADIQAVVAGAIGSGALPADRSGAYFVLTSADVTASSGFCSYYCGWHTHATIAGLDVKYAFIGNPDRCPSACAAQTTSPNGNAGADGMASIIAHELDEMVSDPDLNAWYDRRGRENADKCAWTFGTEYTVSNGSKANVKLGGADYLIQQNWVNVGGGFCAMAY